MLEVRNLKKIYKSKKGADVHALDGVSITFPKTGMVFLLGKSGSGKSTLLNVTGGLDNPTDGEIIVKGRSSKDFTQSDFDSYRNTFIGFIFQEYNILNEFSVEDNIALALELQGKPKDKAAINALLKEVDLDGFAKRKPNTLSGGQKQRIAIARALIKKPEIIMADEPTGALDSNTGKQVFDTLKKLSETKLVIVVSHDRDFAELYGDRIIELKDGLVISDVSKTRRESEQISGNVSDIGDILYVKGGDSLTDSDFDKIKAFLKKKKEDIIIASDEKSVITLKKAAKITDDGAREIFADTDHEAMPKKEYTKEESRFIRSKLPARHAFKIGVSGLRNKPVRLFFTIFLCSVAFILFGLLSTLSFYDSEATFKQTLVDSNLSALRFKKNYQGTTTWFTNGVEDYSYETFFDAQFTPKELSDIAAKYNPDAFGAVSSYYSFNLRQVEGQYWMNQVMAIAALPENNSLRTKIRGEYPKNKNEMVISSYFAEMLKECNVYDATGATLELSTPDDIIGKSISFEGNTYKITGILDSGTLSEEFVALKDAANSENYSLRKKLSKALESGLHLVVFVSEDALGDIGDDYYAYKETRENYMRLSTAIKIGGEFSMPEYANTKYNSVNTLLDSVKLYTVTKEGKNLSDNEVIISTDVFARCVVDSYNRLAENANGSENYTLAEKYYNLANLANDVSSGGTYELNEEKKEHEFKPFSDSVFDAKLNELLAAVKRDRINLSFGAQIYSDYNRSFVGEIKEYSIASVYKHYSENGESTVYLSEAASNAIWEEQKVTIPNYPETETSYVEAPDAIYSYIYLPGAVDPDRLDDFWAIYTNTEFDENDSRIFFTGGMVDTLRMIDGTVKSLSQVFLWVGLILAIFAALLLSNFISVSISQKRREIGILRAVGARSLDVFKIFFSESFVIGFICTLLSAIASSVICGYLNISLASGLGASLLVFGIPSILVLIGIALVTIIVATFLPVYNAAKKKPVDSIRAV
ncbi:MAG: ATP-binding cassette domain-containing protein [Clostridia bacterium]|nr:ATP-binding cassette domain-containing protein [Clostridia bacterium]